MATTLIARRLSLDGYRSTVIARRLSLDGYRSTVSVSGGRYLLPIRREICQAVGLAPGMPVKVALALDEEPRTVETPGDLAAARG
jgi:hypothetical protein